MSLSLLELLDNPLTLSTIELKLIFRAELTAADILLICIISVKFTVDVMDFRGLLVEGLGFCKSSHSVALVNSRFIAVLVAFVSTM